MPQQRISDFYVGQKILITGATGYLGRVLVEKLLRSCPGLEMIYVIVRSKKGQSPEERWKERTNCILFDRLRKERPGALERKVKVLEGDASELRLGLSPEDYDLLQDQVTIIFHAAASVRFNDPFTFSVFINVRSARELVQLALGAKHLELIVHISTAFTNCYQTECEERVYPPPMDWRAAIRIAEQCDTVQLTVLQNKLLGRFPNTYTFTKNLAEALISEHSDILPCVIVRPGIVIPSCEDPFPGWHDNLNGPVGICNGAGSGILRTVLGGDAIQPVIYVDTSIQAIIAVPWHHASRSVKIDVYNLVSPDAGYTYACAAASWQAVLKNDPFKENVWCPASPATLFTTSVFRYKFEAILFHLIPAYFIDTITSALKIKSRSVLAILIKVHIAVTSLTRFELWSWDFTCDNFMILQKEVLPEDRVDFPFGYKDIEFSQWLQECRGITKKVILKESDTEEDLKKAKQRSRRLYLLDLAMRWIAKSFLVFSAIKLAGNCSPSCPIY